MDYKKPAFWVIVVSVIACAVVAVCFLTNPLGDPDDLPQWFENDDALLEHILEMIDLQAASAQLGGMLTSPGYAEAQTETIEQNVHIEASFPAVQDRNEIEEAFNNKEIIRLSCFKKYSVFKDDEFEMDVNVSPNE